MSDFGVVEIVAAIATAATSTYGALQQANAQKLEANYQAQIAANNALIARQQRADALNRGEIDAQNAMRQQAQLIGQQRASLAANGVDVTQGSAVDILASTKFLGAQDVATIQSNAAREAWGYTVQENNYMSESQLNKWRSELINPSVQGSIAGVGSLLSSASSYAASGRFKSSYSSQFKGDGPLLSYQNK